MYFSHFLNLIKYNLRFKENVSYHYFNFVSKIFVQILFPPLMILIWGAKNYGIWIMIISLGALFIGVNFNFTEVVRLEMTKLYKKSKKISLNQLASNLFVSHSINIAFYVLLSLLFYFFISTDEIEALAGLNNNEIQFILIFIFLSFLLESIINYFYPIITFKGYTKNWIHQNTLFLFYSRFLILLGFVFNDFKYLALIYFVANIIRFLAMFYFFLKEKKNIKISLKYFNLKSSCDIFKKSISYSFEKINAVINQNLIILLIGKFFSPSIVALITTARTMFLYLPYSVYDIIYSPALIEFTSLKNMNKQKIIQKVLLFWKPVLFVSFLFIPFSLLLGKPIYSYWISDPQIQISLVFIFLLSTESFLITILNGLKIPFKSNNNFLFITKIETFFSILLLLIIVAFIPSIDNWMIIFMISNVFLFLINIMFIFNYKSYLSKLHGK